MGETAAPAGGASSSPLVDRVVRLVRRILRRAAQTAGALAEGRDANRVLRARLGFGLLLVAFPAAKAGQMAWWKGEDALRQGLLVVVGVAVVATVAAKRTPEAAAWSQVARPRPASVGAVLERRRIGRMALGTAAVASCAASVVAHINGWSTLRFVLTAGALLPLAALVAMEVRRHRRAQAEAALPIPDRAVLWTVAPALLLWFAYITLGTVRGSPFDDTLGDHELLGRGLAGHALFTVLVVGLGEEYLFRGLLLVLSVRSDLGTVGLALISLSFGAWHIPDAWSEGPVEIVGTVVAMAAVSLLVFLPLRLRCRSLAGPALLHAAHNLALRML